MTALGMAPAPVIRPVAWPRLAWVTWRRYRTTFLVTTAVLGALAVYLIVDGHRIRAAYAAVTGCVPTGSAQCQFRQQTFQNNYGQGGLLSFMLVLLPGLVGVVAGAPVLARELETGTYRYAWTQGVGRMRWAVALLLPGAIGAAALSALFGLALAWRDQPLLASGSIQRLDPTNFPTAGIAVAGWALAGYALGAFAGLLCRRVLPGVVTAFGAWFGLAVLASYVVRPDYDSPLTTTRTTLGVQDFAVSEGWLKNGVPASAAQVNAALRPLNGEYKISAHGSTIGVPSGGVDPVQYLTQHGFQQVTRYQPAGRYWPFQWIEFGWLVALAALLLGATVWMLRRRTG